MSTNCPAPLLKVPLIFKIAEPVLISGEVGDQGEQGSTGFTGVTGQQGETGEKGSKGDAGLQVNLA